MRRQKGIAGTVVEEGARLAARAARAVLDDRRGRDAVAVAVGVAQRGKRRLDAVQERLLRAAGLPVRADYEEVSRQVARLKRKIRDLSRQLGTAAPSSSGEVPERRDRSEAGGGSVDTN